MENFKKGDVVYHNTGDYEWVVVYFSHKEEIVNGEEFINLDNLSSGIKYRNSGIKELRRATKEEKEKLFKQFPNLKDKIMSRIISSEHAEEIIEAACIDWSEKLASRWAINIVLKRDISISEEFYKEMRVACTNEQNKLFDKIFGEDNPFKVGDWVFVGDETSIWNSVVELIKIEGYNFYALNKEGKEDFISQSYVKRLATEEEINKVKYFPDGTPCLVKDIHSYTWGLRYADGKGSFYADGKKEGVAVNFDFSKKLDMDNLPIM